MASICTSFSKIFLIKKTGKCIYNNTIKYDKCTYLVFTKKLKGEISHYGKNLFWNEDVNRFLKVIFRLELWLASFCKKDDDFPLSI
jgi:hypothetical protein